MKAKAIKIISLILIIFMAITMVFYVVDAEDQNVTLTLTPRPKIDIVLAKAKTSLDLGGFEKDIKSKLVNQGIDTDDVRVSALEAQQVNLKTSFSWQQDLNKTIGDIKITEGGKNVEMIGNESYPGKNAMWIIPPKDNEDQKFTFEYNIDFGDSFNAAGMLLKVKEESNKLTGYMLSFNSSVSSSDRWDNISSSTGAIWEFTYTRNDNSSNIEKVLKKSLDISTSGELTVETTDSEIKISGGDLPKTEVFQLEKEFGNGYGFFADHYDHNCEDIGSFKLTNINLQATSVKSFNEVLRGADWRDGAYKFLVDVDEKENEELASSSTYGELATRLMNEGIYFVAWGSSKNQTQFENLIKTNDNKGKFIINAGYTSNLEETAKYIKSVLGTLQSSSYLIVNEPIKIGVDPPGILTGTIDDQWTTGKWMVKHDYEYYENNMGQFAQSNMYTDDFITTFDKVGKYEITYKNVPISPSEIYVHRRPVALFDIAIDGTNVTLTDKSYDLDKESQDNGIKERQWKWKETSETNWHDGQLTTIDKTKEYIVQLRVKDFQDTWSTPCNKYVNLKLNNIKPIATFDFKNSEITPYDKLQITDNSYDPAGKKITTRKWEVFDKDDVSKYNSTTQKETYTDLTPGQYRMSLTVTNESGTQSETFSRYFTIIADSIAPEFVAKPIESDWTKGVTVNLEFNDPGLSGFKNYKYEITTTQDKPSQYSNQSTKANDQITLDGTGIKYIHIITEDMAGNISADRVIGPYNLDNEPPEITVTADFQNAVVDKLQVNIKTNDPHSGMKSLKLDGNDLKDINNDTVEILKNGTYTITAEDQLGNTSTKQIQVNNINYECNAGLGHPDYSSSLDKCPICKLLEGVTVTNHEAVYDKTEKSLTYDNPNEAEIVEYYNGSTQKPIEEGSYTYVLKIKYDGTEYNTGISGTYIIYPKPITITSITAEDRQYNKTDVVNISGGQLVGIEQGDEVGFVLPETGQSVNVEGDQITPAVEVGTHNVRINEITLTGAQSHNYKLIQPNITDVSVTITPKDINITEITAEDREYDKTNIVQLKGGQLIGLEEGDTVNFVLPETGTIDDVKIGKYKVHIPEIKLTDEQAHNYNLIPPLFEDVSVTITQRKIKLTDLQAIDKKYDKNAIVKLKGETFDRAIEGDDVKAIIPETGIAESSEVGQWKVGMQKITLEGADSDNYQIIQPEYGEIHVNIFDPEKPFIHIETDVVAVNEDTIEISEPQVDEEGNVIYEIDKKAIDVRYGDEIALQISAYNQGIGAGYVNEIQVELPEGLEMIDSETNKVNKWKTTENNTCTTTKLSFEGGVKNEIPGMESNILSEKSLILECKVTAKDINTQELIIKTKANQADTINQTIQYNEQKEEQNTVQEQEQNTVQDENVVQNENTVQDENIIEQKEDEEDEVQEVSRISQQLGETEIKAEDEIQEREQTEETENTEDPETEKSNEIEDTETEEKETTEIYSTSETKLNVKYTDFSISAKVKHIYNLTAGQEIPSNPEPNTITKFEIHRKQIAQTKIQVIYEIAVENKGNSEGEVDNVIDYLPQGLQFQESQNPGWTLSEQNTIETTEFGTIKPGETKTKEIILNWDMSQTAGTKENKVVLTSTHDIDQRTIYADPNKTLEKEQIKGKILETNNTSQTTVIGSVKTGIHVYITIIASLLLLILLPIVFLIKRKRNNLS